MILLDANILVRMCNKADVDYQRTTQAVFEWRKTESVVIGPQALYEFWAVTTRSPAQNGLDMSAERVRRWVVYYQRVFSLLLEPPDLVETWTAIVAKYDVKGFRAHDARYFALMKTLNIEKLMTYNKKHFQVYPITIIEPGHN